MIIHHKIGNLFFWKKDYFKKNSKKKKKATLGLKLQKRNFLKRENESIGVKWQVA